MVSVSGFQESRKRSIRSTTSSDHPPTFQQRRNQQSRAQTSKLQPAKVLKDRHQLSRAYNEVGLKAPISIQDLVRRLQLFHRPRPIDRLGAVVDSWRFLFSLRRIASRQTSHSSLLCPSPSSKHLHRVTHVSPASLYSVVLCCKLVDHIFPCFAVRDLSLLVDSHTQSLASSLMAEQQVLSS